MIHLIWLDLETTGLDPKKERILEVGVRITNEQLNVLASFSEVLSCPREVLLDMDPFVWGMHTKNGLLPEVLQARLEVGRAGVRMAAALASIRGRDNAGDVAHRALADVDQSIAELQHYTKAMRRAA